MPVRAAELRQASIVAGSGTMPLPDFFNAGRKWI
jgi:hypothetical protein